MTLEFARHLSDLRAEMDLFVTQLTPAELDRQVPTCPAWTLRELAGHLGTVQRWATAVVAGRLSSPVRRVTVPPPDDGALAGWMREGAEAFAGAAEEAGPQTPVWSWAGDDRVAFWARRMANEAAVHAVDAQLVGGRAIPLDPARAADGIDEWFWILAGARGAEKSAQYPVRPGGESLHVHATDPELGGDGEGEWTIRRTTDGIAVERGHVRAAVALRGPASDLFLLLLRRLTPETAAVEVLGDRALLDEWLDHSQF